MRLLLLALLAAAITTSSFAADTPSSHDFVRVTVKILQISDADYQAHHTQIDAAVQRGDSEPLALLPSYNQIAKMAVLNKAGEQGVLEAVRILPYVIGVEKGPDGRFFPTDYARATLGPRVVLYTKVQDGTIRLTAYPWVRSLDGWTDLDTPMPKPQLHERFDQLHDVFTPGQTKGYPFPGGAQMDPIDPTYGYPANAKPDPAKSRKIKSRLFYFITVHEAGEFTAAPPAKPRSQAILIM